MVRPTRIRYLQESSYSRSSIYITLMVLSVWTPFYLSIAILCGLAAYVLCSAQRRMFVIAGNPYGSFVWLIPIISLVSSIAGENPSGAWISIMMFIIFVVGLYAHTIMTKVQFEKNCDLICACSILAAMLAAVQDFVIYGHDANYRPSAFASNANYYGMLVVFAIIISMLRMKNSRNKGVYIITIAVNMCALFMCESRSALAGCLACIFLYLLLKRKFMLAVGFSFVGLAIVVAGWINPELFSWANSLEFVIGQRAAIWDGAVKAYVSDPVSMLIGRGPMAYSMLWESIGAYSAKHAHNIYIDCLLNFGISGTVLTGVLVYKIFQNCSLKNVSGYLRDVRILNILFLAEIAVSGVADNTIFWIQTSVCFLFINSGISIGQMPAIDENSGLWS